MANSPMSGDAPERAAPERDGSALLAEARIERLARAQGYPYPYPETSYLYLDGVALPLHGRGGDPLAGAEVEVAGARLPAVEHLDRLGAGAAAREARTPVLAYGSNRAPVQLGRKYGHWRDPVAIPVRHGWLAGFDVVYAARLAAYGSVAATLTPSPGTVASVSVIWLTDRQLDLMHTTEGIGQHVYCYGRLDGIALTLDGGGALESVFTYCNLDGAILDEGGPIALAAIPARDRIFPARDQLAMLGFVRDRLDPGADLETFILDHIDDRTLGIERSRRLALGARPFEHPGFTRLLG